MSEMGDVRLILLKGEVESIRRLFHNTINELQRHLKNAEERAEVFEGHDDSQYEYFLGEATAYKEALELLGWCGTDKTNKGGWREQPITEKQKEYMLLGLRKIEGVKISEFKINLP